MLLLTGIILTQLGMPWAVFALLGVHGGDTTNAAIIAGVFSVVNTYLNVRMLRQVGAVKHRVGAVSETAREGNAALMEIADIRAADRPKRTRRDQRKDDE